MSIFKFSASMFIMGAAITLYNYLYGNRKQIKANWEDLPNTQTIVIDVKGNYKTYYSIVHKAHTSAICVYTLPLMNCLNNDNTVFIVKCFDFKIVIILDKEQINEICGQINSCEILLNVCHSDYFYKNIYAEPLSPIIFFSTKDSNGVNSHFRVTKPFCIITPLYCRFPKVPNWIVCKFISTAVANAAFWDYIKTDPIDSSSNNELVQQPLWDVENTSELLEFVSSGDNKYIYTKQYVDSLHPKHYTRSWILNNPCYKYFQ